MGIKIKFKQGETEEYDAYSKATYKDGEITEINDKEINSKKILESKKV